MTLYYVYLHLRADTGTPFYIGKGKGKRAWSRKSRSVWWHRIADKHGLTVTILAEGLSEAAALSAEVSAIALFGRETLCNLTDGGEGSSGYVATAETRLKLSRSNSNPSAEVRARKSAAQKGHVLSEASRKKLSDSKKRMMTDETKARIGDSRRGKTHSAETLEKISKAIRGRTLSPEWRAKIGAAQCLPIRTSCGLEFNSAKDACEWLRENGAPKADASGVSKCCKGKQALAYGYVWEYVTSDAKPSQLQPC